MCTCYQCDAVRRHRIEPQTRFSWRIAVIYNRIADKSTPQSELTFRTKNCPPRKKLRMKRLYFAKNLPENFPKSLPKTIHYDLFDNTLRTFFETVRKISVSLKNPSVRPSKNLSVMKRGHPLGPSLLFLLIFSLLHVYLSIHDGHYYIFTSPPFLHSSCCSPMSCV